MIRRLLTVALFLSPLGMNLTPMRATSKIPPPICPDITKNCPDSANYR